MPSSAAPTSLVFVIRSLEIGGAERQLVALTRGLKRHGFAPVVATFYSGGALEADLAAAGVPLVNLEKQGRWDLIGPYRRLRALLRETRPALIHSFLTTGNLLALAARAAAPQARLIWGWRASGMDYSHYSPWVRVTERVEVALSRRVDLILANAQSGKRDRVAQGAPAARIAVIDNGIDAARFAPDPAARQRLRAEWGLTPATPAIGVLARLDPMKGHDLFLEAAALAAAQRADLRFVVLGGGTSEAEARLKNQAEALGLAERVIWAGARQDVPAALSALDLHCSSSRFGEGFSNAVAESMACGLPNVVTDVGDSARLVGTLGLAVPPGDAAALAEAWLGLLDRLAREGEALRTANRARIAETFSLDTMVARHAETYRALLGGEV